MTPIQFQCTVDTISTRADKSIKVSISTQELSDESAGKLMGLRNQFMWVAFAPIEISVEDLNIPERAPEFKGEKTPSARLRAVLYVRWKQSGIQTDFETYRLARMTEIIDKEKSFLIPE